MKSGRIAYDSGDQSRNLNFTRILLISEPRFLPHKNRTRLCKLITRAPIKLQFVRADYLFNIHSETARPRCNSASPSLAVREVQLSKTITRRAVR